MTTPTVYLKFPNLGTAIKKMALQGFSFSEYFDHIASQESPAFGTAMPDPDSSDILVNIYLMQDCPEDWLPYQIETPSSPYNVLAE